MCMQATGTEPGRDISPVFRYASPNALVPAIEPHPHQWGYLYTSRSSMAPGWGGSGPNLRVGASVVTCLFVCPGRTRESQKYWFKYKYRGIFDTGAISVEDPPGEIFDQIEYANISRSGYQDIRPPSLLLRSLVSVNLSPPFSFSQVQFSFRKITSCLPNLSTFFLPPPLAAHLTPRRSIYRRNLFRGRR